jgi:hypothetical protein
MAQKTLEQLISKEEVENIIEMYQNNASLREIERKTHHGRNAIAKMLERLGIKTTTGNHYRKYFFDFDFFEKIDSKKKAYWLGFLYADGSILSQDPRGYGEQEFKLSLGECDREVLEHYKEDLKSTYPIRKDICKNIKTEGKAQIQLICSYRSQKTVEDLKKLGCVENKSLILKFPNEQQVPKEFIYDFIRGYFDGDGSISEYKDAYQISFVGTQDFISKLATYFEGGSVFPDKRKTNSWYFNLGGNLQVLKAYHLMYDNADRYMERKYLKFQPLLQKYNES